MTERRTLRSTDTLRRHLLTGASVAVIALASAAVVAPGSAWAQQDQTIDGVDNAPTFDNDPIATGDTIVGVDTTGDAGAIDVDGVTSLVSITIDDDARLFVFDSDTAAGGDTVTVGPGGVAIDAGVALELSFGASDFGGGGTVFGAATMTIEGDLDDGAGGTGGTLAVNSVAGGGTENGLNVNGSTNMDIITVTGGDASATADGGDIRATFGDDPDSDTFELVAGTGDLTVTGGAGGGDTTPSTTTGGDAITIINALDVDIDGTTTVAGGNGTLGTDDVVTGASGDGSLTINIGDAGAGEFAAIDVTGGTGGNGASNADDPGVGGNGGDAMFTLNGGTSTATDFSVVAGNGGTGGDDAGAGDADSGFDGGIGGDANATIAANTDLALTGDLTVIGGTDGAAGTDDGGGDDDVGTGGEAGDAMLNIDGTISVDGNVIFDDDSDGTAEIIIGENGLLQIAGNVTDGDATGTDTDLGGAITFDGGGTVQFNSGGNQTSDDVTYDGPGTLLISEDGTDVEFTDADIGAGTPLGAIVVNDDATALFGEGAPAGFTVNVVDVSVGANDDTDVATLELGANTTITGDVQIGAGSVFRVDIDDDNDGAADRGNIDVSIAGDVLGSGVIQIDDGTGNVADLIFNGGTNSQLVEVAIEFDDDGQGVVQTQNTEGLTFDGQIGSATEAAEDVQIGEENNVTFNGQVWTDLFSMEGDTSVDGGTTDLTFNATTNVQVNIIDDDGTTELTLANSDILLGANISTTDDIIFQSTGTGADLSFTDADDDIVVSLSSNFTSDHVTFLDDDGDQTIAAGNDITENDTALTEFSVVYLDGGGAVVADPTATNFQDIRITAERRTNAAIANALGISTEQAAALASAVDAAAETFAADQTDANEDLVDAFTDVLNNTNGAANLFSASAQTAAETVGTQSSTLGGASQTAFTAFGDIFNLIANSGGGFGGFNLLNGFGGGDLIVSQPSYAAPVARSHNGSVWGLGFGGIANADGDSNFEGYDANYGGVVIGVDGAITEDFTVGAFGTYFMSTVDGDGAADAEIEADTFGFGAYASYDGPDFYLDAFAAYGMSDNDLTRTATVGALTQRLSADYDASQFSIGAAAGVPIEVSAGVYITPNASLTWNHYDADTYTETGGTLAQTVNSDTVSQLTGTIGARIHAVYDNFDSDGTVFIPELRVALIGDIADDDATASVAFTGGGASYQVTGTDTDDIGALVGVGFGLDNPDWSATLNYDADLRGDFMSHTARAEFRWKF